MVLTERHIVDIGLYVRPFGHGSCSLERKMSRKDELKQPDSVDPCPQAGGLRRLQGACPRLAVMQIHAVIGPGNGVHPTSRNKNRAVVKPISGFHIQVA